MAKAVSWQRRQRRHQTQAVCHTPDEQVVYPAGALLRLAHLGTDPGKAQLVRHGHRGLDAAAQRKGTALATKAVETQGKYSLSHEGSGSTRQRYCLSHEGSGSTRQRDCLTWMPVPVQEYGWFRTIRCAARTH